MLAPSGEILVVLLSSDRCALLGLRKPAFICIAVDILGETVLGRKDTIVDRSRKDSEGIPNPVCSKILNNLELTMENQYRMEHVVGGLIVLDGMYEGTTNVGLVYGIDHGNHVNITGFVDSDYAKDPDKGRSIIGYVFLVQGCIVRKKASTTRGGSLLATKAEYMALTKVVNEAIWLRGLFEELVVKLNTMAVKEVLEAKTVEVLKVGTEYNDVDALTNVVPGLKLQHCLELLSFGVG
ncbi:hypothetical protein Tco_0979259 [Tanacetum coccineum]